MAQPFNIPRTRCSLPPDPALRDEIQAHTDNATETSSILRSIERFGNDLSIRYYELTPTVRRSHFHSASASWTVRAVR
jgi:hypothetical protein